MICFSDFLGQPCDFVEDYSNTFLILVFLKSCMYRMKMCELRPVTLVFLNYFNLTSGLHCCHCNIFYTVSINLRLRDFKHSRLRM